MPALKGAVPATLAAQPRSFNSPSRKAGTLASEHGRQGRTKTVLPDQCNFTGAGGRDSRRKAARRKIKICLDPPGSPQSHLHASEQALTSSCFFYQAHRHSKLVRLDSSLNVGYSQCGCCASPASPVPLSPGRHPPTSTWPWINTGSQHPRTKPHDPRHHQHGHTLLDPSLHPSKAMRSAGKGKAREWVYFKGKSLLPPPPPSFPPTKKGNNKLKTKHKDLKMSNILQINLVLIMKCHSEIVIQASNKHKASGRDHGCSLIHSSRHADHSQRILGLCKAMDFQFCCFVKEDVTPFFPPPFPTMNHLKICI